MIRFNCIALALILAVVISGCDGASTYRNRPLSYWIEASRSSNLQTKQQAIAALMTFTRDPKATARLAEIRSETLVRRNENWKQLVTWLNDAAQTREHRVTITTYLDNMPDTEDGIVQYTATALPGKWQETREILLTRSEQAGAQDRDLYQALMYRH